MLKGRLTVCLRSVLWVVCLWHVIASGQTPAEQIYFDRISIPGTIRSSQVQDLIQDKIGMMWLAGDGLYRYDGFRFKQYKEIKNIEATLSSREIHQLLYDKKSDRILLATQRYGVCVYDYNSDQISQFPSEGLQPVVHLLAEDRNGMIWAGSYSSGLFYIKNDTLRKLPDPEKRFLNPSGLYSVGTKLYVGGQGKVIVLDNGRFVKEIVLQEKEIPLPAYTLTTTLYVDRSENLWIGTEKHGVLVYSLKAEKFVNYFSPAQPPFFSKISRILEDQSGLVWILTKANGVAIYDPKSGDIKRLSRDPFSSKSLSSDNCFSIVEDREGIIWIGATGDVNKYNRRQIKFQHIYHNPSSRMSLTDNMVRGLFEDNDQKLWAGTDGGYINIIDPEKKRIEYIKVKVQGDSSNFVPLYFEALNDKIILVGTSLGLLEYDRAKKTFQPYQPLWDVTKNRNIRQILRKDNYLFFIYNGQFYVHHLIKRTTELYKNGGHPLAVNITTIHLDKHNRLWIGSNRGVSYFDSEKKSFSFIPLKRDTAQSSDVSLMMVLSINVIGNKLYAGTFNSGLWVIDIGDFANNRVTKKYVDEPGLSSPTIYSTLAGNDGFLWLSTNSGLVRMDTTSKQFMSFTVSEGVQEEEFNRLAYCKTSSGKLAFGGINGLNIFDPSSVTVPDERFTPKVVSIFASNPLLKKSNPIRISNPTGKTELQYDQNFINIHFFVPYFEQPKRYALYYRLENFEKEWKEIFSENTISYSNLEPGEYAFVLKSISLNGNEQIINLPVIIHPPIWKTWWFVILAVVVVAFLIMTIVNSYISRSQRDRERLEDLLRMRTSEIEKSREELQILNEKKDLIFSILSHDLRSPLTTLKGFLGYLIDHSDELTNEELVRHAINIRNSVSNSLDLIDNTLFWSLSQMGTIQYTPSNFSLHALLEKLKGLYQLTADKKRIPFSITCPQNIMVTGDENMIYVTLRNLVSNALKFTTEGNPVSITCAYRDGDIEINVVDRGIGMSKEYVNRILSRDQPMLKKGTSNEKGTGLGLLLCKNFIEQNKGELRITSVENVGTTFTVILPSGKPASEVTEAVTL
jgi:signal transduction histidine kinase/ligand-binding sensor domain-containing protein